MAGLPRVQPFSQFKLNKMREILSVIFLVMAIVFLIGANLLQFFHLPSSDILQNGLICLGFWSILVSLKKED